MNVKLLTEQHLEFLRLKGGCRGLSESTLVKMSNCWKSHAGAQLLKKFWPHSSLLFRAIVDCLALTMEKSESKPAKLEVDAGAIPQKISMRKYVTQECQCDVSYYLPLFCQFF